MRASSFAFLSVLFLAGFMLGEAYTMAALLGGGATAFVYATGIATLGPIGLGAMFLGSTAGLQFLSEKIDNEYAMQRLSETKLDRQHWVNCSRPAYFSTHRACRSKRHCEDTVQVHGSYDCNACGANALTARRWINPLDTSDYSTEAVCMDTQSRTIFTPPASRTPAGYWNCAALPHFQECRRCGDNTAFARYDRLLTSAGLQTICIRTDGAIEQKFA